MSLESWEAPVVPIGGAKALGKHQSKEASADRNQKWVQQQERSQQHRAEKLSLETCLHVSAGVNLASGAVHSLKP